MERRLAAILAADVVGYSRMMQLDEGGTLAALKARREEVLRPMLAKHHGRIVKLMGDGVLVDFPSAVNAVACAVELQEAMNTANVGLPEDRRIVLRIGINLGDVMVEGSDLYGDGVNIAARLERLAEPGGILVSQTVFSHVRGKVQLDFEDLGEQSLKNMAEPVRVYGVSGTAAVELPIKTVLPSKLSIAVLPFTNMSGDPEQEYFSDGITEDIITDLSKVSVLNVMPRNTVFTFKGKAVDVGHIARQLKVGHVVEGSVRKSGGRVRITGQLIDASKHSHVWAERYDRNLNDIFALQDEISKAIVTALKVRLLPDEKTAIETRSTHDPQAYQLYLLGRHYHALRGRNLEIALRFYRRALEIDANYARAWALLAVCEADLHYRGRSEETGLESAERALSLNPALAEAYAAKGRALAEIGRYDEALAAHEDSLRLEPDSFDVRANFGRTCFMLGRHEAAIEHDERAAQILDTDYVALNLVTMSYTALGRHGEAESAGRRALERIEKQMALRPDNSDAVVAGAIVLARLGERERAKEWASRALIIDPDDAMDHYNLSCALAQMNEPDQAIDALESCLHKMSAEMIKWVKQDSDFIPLRDHPRFQALVARGEARLVAVLAEQAAKSSGAPVPGKST
jgi:adenylate cyclase